MIESYDFGTIIIDGKRYTNDVIVFPSKVKDKWWRKEGHRLVVEDLEEALKADPHVVVVGTGYSGLMKVSHEVTQKLDREGIQLVVEKTGDAAETFNKLANSNKKVVAALHLTC